ncbi:MAG: cytochrome C [Deltaproteobacteria bacterium]|nr:cytochrome C [Deltaproteobacteria bacterium]
MTKWVTGLLALYAAVLGCAMLGSWRAIPPPGGCDQCHKEQISADWQVAYAPAIISTERGGESWQRPDSVLPPQPSPLEQKKITEQQCFRCHKSPDRAHREYRGNYHHKPLF